jgi:hypothetical protein
LFPGEKVALKISVVAIRVRYPAFHRWMGRIYVAAAVLLAAVGGFTGWIWLLWVLLTGSYGHIPGFSGGFDKGMTFFIYLPNLTVAEVFIRLAKQKSLHCSEPAFFYGATAFNWLSGAGYVLFTKMHCGPAIVEWLF